MKLIQLLFFSFLAVSVCAQSAKEERKAANKERPKYLDLGTGINVSYFRDFATGPIFYRSAANSVMAHYHRFDSDRETRFGTDLSFGIYSFQIENERASSLVRTLNLDFGKLYRLEKLSNDKYSVKAGGTFLFTGNMRIDPALQNSGFGYEFIYNLMASAKVSRDVSRKEAKRVKLWFIKYNLQPRQRLLSYQLNLGVLNSHIRNGYAYVNQNGILNEPSFLADYEHTFFQGFRMNSALFYTLYLNKGNALRFSYVWDAYTTGQEEVKLEMANHMFGVAFLFQL